MLKVMVRPGLKKSTTIFLELICLFNYLIEDLRRQWSEKYDNDDYDYGGDYVCDYDYYGGDVFLQLCSC
jgi:hypothetical protein